ncbi:hypothetical protein HK102_005922 [Quaeritorhiza haematococci]|nr:hypothetical protein HK102_005922 [Quaeritorhiza haematococci]
MTTKSIGVDVGVRNLAFCLVERPSTILKWELYDLDDYTDIRDVIKTFMNGVHPVDIIAIEKQPKCNVLMDSVGHVLSCAFYEFYLGSRPPLITFIPPASKYDLPDFRIDNGTTYEDRKSKTVENILRVLGPDSDWKRHLLGYRKKDDLADAFVLALLGLEKF